MNEGSQHVSTGAIRRVLGYVTAAACLIWVFHGIQGGRLFSQMKAIRWGWIAVAVACAGVLAASS